MVLAHLLLPTQFGLIAGVTSAMAFANIATSWGFGTNLIRKRHLTQVDTDGALWASLFLGAVLAFALIGLAPWIADGLHNRSAGPMLAVVAVSLIFDTTAKIPMSLLQRRMQFGRLYVAQGLDMAVYVSFELLFAFLGLGAWSVICGLTLGSLTGFVASFTMAKFRLGLANPLSWFRHERSFAAGSMSSQLIGWLNKNMDYWFVGIVLGTTSLGIYYIAFTLPSIVRLRLTAVLNTVLAPIFAQTVPGEQRLITAYKRSTLTQLSLGFPAIMGIAALAGPIVHTFFGHRWDAAIGPTRVIALMALVDLMAAAPSRVALARGQFSKYLTSETSAAAALGCGLLITRITSSGLMTVAISVLVGRVVALIVSWSLIAKPNGIGIQLLARELLILLPATAVMCVSAAWTVQFLHGTAPAVQLAGGVLTGALTYGASCFLLSPRLFRTICADATQLILGRASRKA